MVVQPTFLILALYQQSRSRQITAVINLTPFYPKQRTVNSLKEQGGVGHLAQGMPPGGLWENPRPYGWETTVVSLHYPTPKGIISVVYLGRKRHRGVEVDIWFSYDCASRCSLTTHSLEKSQRTLGRLGVNRL